MVAVVAPRHEAVAHAETQQVGRVDAVDHVELREIQRRQLRRRHHAVELQDLVGREPGIVHVGVIGKGLEDMHEAIEPEQRGLNLLEPGRKFERPLEPRIHDGTESAVAVIVAGQSDVAGRIRIRVAGAAVVGSTKTDPRRQGKPAEVGFRIGQLMKRVEAEGRVILQSGGIAQYIRVEHRLLQLRDVIRRLTRRKIALEIAAPR